MILYSNFFVENYQLYYEEIADKNLKNLGLITTLGVFMGIPLLFISFFIDGFQKAFTLYFLILCTSLVFHFLAKSYLAAHKRLIPAAFYFMYSVLLFVSMYLGVFLQPETNAAAFIVFLVVLPLFMIDIPSRMCMFMGIFCMIFCVLDKVYKAPYTISFDIINGAVFYLLSIFTSHQYNYLTFKQIISNNVLAVQRDTDTMTGLWNRGFCERNITACLSLPNSCGALMVLDIDNFKLINDSKGHEFGDQVLKEIGSALLCCFRASDILGRLGGDEFLVFLPGCTDGSIISGRIVKFLERISVIHTADHHLLPKIGASAGIAIAPADGATFAELYRHADEALYSSKTGGKQQFAFYTANQCTGQLPGRL